MSDAAVTPSTSTAAKEGCEVNTQDALDMLALGKRNMLCNEVPQAVNQLQQACTMLAKKYGETADECGDAYFSYGKALLHLARMESDVLGNALQGISEDEEGKSEASEEAVTEEEMSEGEKEDLSDKIIEAMEERDAEEKPKDEETGEGEKAEDGEKETTEESAMESEDIEEEGEEEEGEATSADDEDKEEDVTNLQLAWEMLELSKIIYKRHTKKEDQIKLAETHLRLGEVGLETGHFDQALGDLKECLKIQKSVLEPEDRDIAETSYQLGLAYTCMSEYDLAVQSYKEAATCIEAKIEMLKKLTDGTKKEENKETEDKEITAAKKEIIELEGILPDIAGKMQDVLDEQQTTEKVKECVKQNLIGETSGETTTGFGDSDKTTDAKPVRNITHLVRKKRKPEAEEEEPDETKKARTEPNEGCTNGHENGQGDVETSIEMEQTAPTS